MILGIDTASPSCSAALVQGNDLVACSHLAEQSTASTHLVRLIDDMCVGVGLAVDDAAAVAVNLGPGAFTGLRVGLATAQGLATAYRKPLVGCSTFEALVDAGWRMGTDLSVRSLRHAVERCTLPFTAAARGRHTKPCPAWR